MKPEDSMRAMKTHGGSEDFVTNMKTEAERGWDIQRDGERIQSKLLIVHIAKYCQAFCNDLSIIKAEA